MRNLHLPFRNTTVFSLKAMTTLFCIPVSGNKTVKLAKYRDILFYMSKRTTNPTGQAPPPLVLVIEIPAVSAVLTSGLAGIPTASFSSLPFKFLYRDGGSPYDVHMNSQRGYS